MSGGALTKYMHPILLPLFEAEPEPEVSTLEAALAALNAGQLINRQTINAPASAGVQPRQMPFTQGHFCKTFDSDTYFASRELLSCGRRQMVPVKTVHPPRFAGGGPSSWQAYDLDVVLSTNFHRMAGGSTVWSSTYDAMSAIDSDMLRSVLVNVFKSDRYEAPLEHNLPAVTVVDFLPRTTDVTTELDEREVAILESKQQRDAILVAKDFRATLQTLVDEEQFSNHDLTQIIGVTRAMLVTWRDRPLEKIRQVNHAAMGRLLFAWKYWLHVTEGELFGRYLRHVPEQCATSLLRLLADHEPTEDEISRHIDRLAAYATGDRKAAAMRRRDLGGLPVSAYQRDVAFD